MHGLLGRYVRASLYDLKVPYPHGSSGKRTLAYSATKILNELRSDLKEFSTSSPPTFKFLPPLFNLNYKISFSHPYPLFSLFRYSPFYCVFIVYSTLNIVSLIYLLKFIFEGHRLENCDMLLHLPLPINLFIRSHLSINLIISSACNMSFIVKFSYCYYCVFISLLNSNIINVIFLILYCWL